MSYFLLFEAAKSEHKYDHAAEGRCFPANISLVRKSLGRGGGGGSCYSYSVLSAWPVCFYSEPSTEVFALWGNICHVKRPSERDLHSDQLVSLQKEMIPEDWYLNSGGTSNLPFMTKKRLSPWSFWWNMFTYHEEKEISLLWYSNEKLDF